MTYCILFNIPFSVNAYFNECTVVLARCKMYIQYVCVYIHRQEDLYMYCSKCTAALFEVLYCTWLENSIMDYEVRQSKHVGIRR